MLYLSVRVRSPAGAVESTLEITLPLFPVETPFTPVSLAITHFAVGAALTTLAVGRVVPRTAYPRTLAVLGGLWAMLPDAEKFVDLPGLAAFHGGPLANLCWFHGALDALDVADAPEAGAAALAALALTTLWAERRGADASEAVPPADAAAPRTAD